MKKFAKILLSSAGLLVLLSPVANAVCPVCTVAVGVGLEGARLLGVDDVITGVWAGGLTLSVFFWTAGWLKNKGVKNIWLQIIVPFVLYYGLLGCVYFLPGVQFGANALWGADKFLIGIITGTLAFYLGARWYAKIKRDNGGHAKFAFQKVVVPVSFLLIATAVFAAILYL
ncbi:MAG: hypothetical protein LBF28_02275 [Rickettsiales bacterium]|jgi:hypothetical protein|nr:hypothetical protein [Rickettsiales bacterium]